MSSCGQCVGKHESRLTLEALSLGDSNDVDHLVLGKDLLAADLLLEVLAGEGDLVGDGAAVQLDLHDVGLLLPAPQQLLLGVADQTNHGAVLGDLSELLLDLLLAEVILPLLAGLGERLLFRLGPEGKTGTSNQGPDKRGDRNLEGPDPRICPAVSTHISSYMEVERRCE